MTLDSLPDLDTSGLCLVKTLSTALTCWPYRNTALRDGARTSTRTAGPRCRGKPKHSHLGHPVPGPGNVAAKRCASSLRRIVLGRLHLRPLQPEGHVYRA